MVDHWEEVTMYVYMLAIIVHLVVFSALKALRKDCKYRCNFLLP